MFPATSGPISPVINTPRAGSPAASEREATTIQNSRQTPMTMEVDDTFPVSYQTDDVDLVDEQESISRGSRVLDVLHVEMNLSDSESDTSSVIMLQEQDHDEAVDNLRPGLLSLAVTDGRADTALPTVLFPESDPDGPVSMASLEAHSSSKRRPSDMTANAMEPGSAADPVVPVAPCNNEDIDQTDDQPLRQISVKANDPKTETTTPSHYGQRRPLSMKDKTTLIYGVPKNVEIDSIESLSDDASVVEIDRDEMLYSSDSSDSSIESVDAESYKLAIRLSRAATNRALLPSQEMMAQEMKDRALRAAARAGDSRSVQRLIAKGADIHSRSKSGMMALHTAALHGHPQVVGLLLQLGSDVDKTVCGSVEIPYKHSDIRMLKSLRDPDSLRLACSKGHQDVAKLLLSHQPSGINHALICAVFFGVDPIVFMLLYWGNETNHLNAKDKENALHLAALLNYQSTVELLLSGLSSHDNVELAAILVLTIHAQNRQLCELIVKRGPNMKYRDGDGETPLTIAIETGKIDIVKVVLDASGSDLDYHNDNGDTPLTVAVRNNNRDIVKLLLDSGASIDYRSAPGDTALILAVLLERRDMIELLLSRGASVECKSAYGNPALILAVWQGMRDVVELLLSRGASVECRSAHGDTALVLAVREGMTDMVELLLRRGVSMEYTVEHGDTALTYAISRNKAAIVTLLVNNGANVHHRASSGNTPLVLAFQTGNEYLVKLLLDKGATV
jgi:ankyrin repeat protein